MLFTNIYFFSSWGENHDQLLDRYKYQTPDNNGIWKEIRAWNKIDECKYYIVMQGFSKKIDIDSKKIIYFQREPLKWAHPNCDGMEVKFRGKYEDHHHVGTWQIRKSFNELYNLSIPEKKKKLVCIFSNQRITELHKLRLSFLKNLIKKYPKEIDVYGRGLGFENLGESYKGELNYNKYCKFEGLKDYKYCLTVENSEIKNYFTEKIIDCFLTWTKPIYFGCPNINEYFSEDSYEWLDIRKEESVDKIIQIINKPISYIVLNNARMNVLYKYNLWSCIDRVIDKLENR